MWISKWKWDRLNDRLENLEREVRYLKTQQGVTADREGLLYWWEGGPSILTAINALAKHVNFSWKVTPARPASLDGEKR
jgi:hypothetical protein